MAAYAALVFFKPYYSNILHYYDTALPPEIVNMCEGALKELKLLQDFVERLDGRSRSRTRMSAWLQRIPDAFAESRQMLIDASEIDDLVEASRTVLETLKKIQEELVEIEEEEVVSFQSSSNKIGLGDERSKLKEALVNYYMEDPVYLVHGMAGIGKTMLAREIYENLDISQRFECRAWVTTGNECTPQQITEAILSQLDPEMLMREEDARLMLKECLVLKRWLIVVDDLWNIDIILDLKKTLRSTGIEGSRLLFTSRIDDYNFDMYVLEKRLLNKEESWDLLRIKVFAGGSFPPQLEHSGKKIAEKCDGLPLTIITVADLLSNAEESLWIDVAEKKKHRVFIDAYDLISEVLHPSYKELHDGFKLCFLYMGVFPLKYEIHRSKLINLWSAEKIFEEFEEKESPYVTFLNLITYLNCRSLVMDYERSASSSLISNSSFQPISTCGLHSSWWHYCQREARKINFFHVLDCPEDALEEGIKYQSRLNIHNNVLFALKDVYNSIEENCDNDIILDLKKTLRYTGLEGSRLLFTSRIKDSNFEGYLLEKRLLNKEESWDLLRHKVFAGGSCPPQLEHSGKKIAEKCDGLPLTIITVADLLSNAEESLWIDVAEKKKHRVFIDAYDQISEVLHPSYKELHDGFKLCFLYMGVFPLKYEIHRSKLINLWSVEKIYKFEEEESPYITFLSLIDVLNDHSLVMVYERSASSSFTWNSALQPISICGLHSSWWHFCQREARKINFFHVLDCPEDALQEGIKDQSRLSIHNNVLFALKDVYNSIEENCVSTAQSLLCFGPYNQYMVPLCFGLKFLQRLDALNIRFYDFPLEVLELAKLLYLALTCNRQLPPSISKLKKIQYLIVHPHLSIKSCGTPTYMPMEIWDLDELEHLEVLGSDLPDPNGDKSLEMLSTLLDVSTASCSVLDKLPNLKKLRIRIVLTPEAPDSFCCFPHISNLGNISSMTCIVVNPQVVPPVASFPVLPYELIKLSLSGLGYPWEKMKAIAASLVSLRVLELQCTAFQGPLWEVEESDFIELKSLLIEGLDLVKLKAEPGSFSNLNHVSIKHCYKFEEIQLRNFAKISKIEVVDSNPLVEKSIKQIMIETTILPKHFSVHCSWKSA